MVQLFTSNYKHRAGHTGLKLSEINTSIGCSERSSDGTAFKRKQIRTALLHSDYSWVLPSQKYTRDTIVRELFQILKQYSGDHLFCDAHEYKSIDNQIKTSLVLYKRTIVSGVKFPVTTSYADSQVLYLNLCK